MCASMISPMPKTRALSRVDSVSHAPQTSAALTGHVQLVHSLGTVDATSINQLRTVIEQVVSLLNNPVESGGSEWKEKVHQANKQKRTQSKPDTHMSRRKRYVHAVLFETPKLESPLPPPAASSALRRQLSVTPQEHGARGASLRKQSSVRKDTTQHAARSAKPSDKWDYNDIITDAAHYVALFRVNRSTQSVDSCLNDIHSAEAEFATLLKDVTEIIEDSHIGYHIKIDDAMKALNKWLNDRSVFVKRAFTKDTAMLQSAYKTKLADAISLLEHNSKVEHENALKALKMSHEQELLDFAANVMHTKKTILQKNHEISKLRNIVAKYQQTMRRHGIPDTEDYMMIDDEKMRTEDIMDFFRYAISSREQKLQDMYRQIGSIEDSLGWSSSVHGSQVWQVKTIYGSAKPSSPPDQLSPRSRMPSARGPRTASASPSRSGLDTGGNESNTGMSLAMPTGSRPTSRMSNSRGKSFGRDLTSVEERVTNAALTSPKPRTAASRRSSITHTSRRRSLVHSNAVSTPSTATSSAPQVAGFEPLTEEEEMDITLHVRNEYERKLKLERSALEAKIAFEREEIVRLENEFKTRYEELAADVTKNRKIMDQLLSGQASMMKKVNVIFPYWKVPGKSEASVQCSLDPSPSTSLW